MNHFAYFTKCSLQIVAWHIAGMPHTGMTSVLQCDKLLFLLSRLYNQLYPFKLIWMTGGNLKWMGLVLQYKVNYYCCHSFWQQMFCLALWRQWGMRGKCCEELYGAWLSWQILLALFWFASEPFRMWQGQSIHRQKYTRKGWINTTASDFFKWRKKCRYRIASLFIGLAGSFAAWTQRQRKYRIS